MFAGTSISNEPSTGMKRKYFATLVPDQRSGTKVAKKAERTFAENKAKYDEYALVVTDLSGQLEYKTEDVLKRIAHYPRLGDEEVRSGWKQLGTNAASGDFNLKHLKILGNLLVNGVPGISTHLLAPRAGITLRPKEIMTGDVETNEWNIGDTTVSYQTLPKTLFAGWMLGLRLLIAARRIPSGAHFDSPRNAAAILDVSAQAVQHIALTVYGELSDTFSVTHECTVAFITEFARFYDDVAIKLNTEDKMTEIDSEDHIVLTTFPPHVNSIRQLAIGIDLKGFGAYTKLLSVARKLKKTVHEVSTFAGIKAFQRIGLAVVDCMGFLVSDPYYRFKYYLAPDTICQMSNTQHGFFSNWAVRFLAPDRDTIILKGTSLSKDAASLMDVLVDAAHDAAGQGDTKPVDDNWGDNQFDVMLTSELTQGESARPAVSSVRGMWDTSIRTGPLSPPHSPPVRMETGETEGEY
nr:TPA_asm: hypothetical protein [Triaenorhabdovirus 1]